MDAAIDLTGLEDFQRRLNDPSPIMLEAGKLIASAAQDAFDKQGLEGHPDGEWKPRYPDQTPPKVNLAGAIMDLSKGPNIQAHRFQDRPALIDTGSLRRSLAPGDAVAMKGKFIVEVGSTLPYAGLHQFGGETSIPLTETIKDNLRAWHKKERGRVDRAVLGFKPYSYGKGKRKSGFGIGTAASRWLDGVWSHLAPILNLDSWDQPVLARPFLGMTAPIARRITRMVADWLAGGPSSGPVKIHALP